MYYANWEYINHASFSELDCRLQLASLITVRDLRLSAR